MIATDPSILVILSLAFGLGLIHALDADHIMAISNLVGTQSKLKTTLIFCSHWATGHAFALLLIGFVVLILGLAVPTRLSQFAEQGVGLVLILLGIWTLVDLKRRQAHVHFHPHDGHRAHAHWHTHNNKASHDHVTDEHDHRHGAMFIGVFHGMAGSAPLFALVPLTKLDPSWLGMAYLLIFALGVLVSMLIFGGMVGGIIQLLSKSGFHLIDQLRRVVACCSIGFGIYLFGAFA